MMSKERHVIMLVDDDPICLAMGTEMLQDKYTICPVSSGDEALNSLKKTTPDLILLDIDMPGMNGHEVIKQLKRQEETKNIPVVFLTGRSDPGNELEGLSLGAIDYVTKPFSLPLLMQRIENHLKLAGYNQDLQKMVNEQTKKIKALQNAILSTVSELTEFRDELSQGHTGRILRYIRAMVEAMQKQGVYKEEVEGWDKEVFISAAQMYDVGKICVGEAILSKQGKLSASEFDEIKKHPAYGLMIIDRIRQTAGNDTFLDYAGIFADSHHERWDGNGYPEKRKETDIPLAGRLMAIADVYDTLVSFTNYKQPMRPCEAAEEIIRGAGAAFDPALVEVFITITDEFAQIAERHDLLI